MKVECAVDRVCRVSLRGCLPDKHADASHSTSPTQKKVSDDCDSDDALAQTQNRHKWELVHSFIHSVCATPHRECSTACSVWHMSARTCVPKPSLKTVALAQKVVSAAPCGPRRPAALRSLWPSTSSRSSSLLCLASFVVVTRLGFCSRFEGPGNFNGYGYFLVRLCAD